MAAGEDATQGVRRWIEKSGFPLQMTTAHKISKAEPATLEQGGYYKDVNTSEWREFDVLAEWHGTCARTEVNIKACIECKTSDNPWVVFSDDALSVQAEYSGSIVDASIVMRSDAVIPGDADQFNRALMGSALQELHLEDEVGAFVKAAHSREDVPHYAIQQAVSMARGVVKEEVESYAGSGLTVIAVALPIVITNVNLFKCSLDIASGDWSLEECQAISVRAPRDNHATGISPTVRIVTERALPQLSATLEGATWAVSASRDR